MVGRLWVEGVMCRAAQPLARRATAGLAARGANGCARAKSASRWSSRRMAAQIAQGFFQLGAVLVALVLALSCPRRRLSA